MAGKKTGRRQVKFSNRILYFASADGSLVAPKYNYKRDSGQREALGALRIGAPRRGQDRGGLTPPVLPQKTPAKDESDMRIGGIRQHLREELRRVQKEHRWFNARVLSSPPSARRKCSSAYPPLFWPVQLRPESHSPRRARQQAHITPRNALGPPIRARTRESSTYSRQRQAWPCVIDVYSPRCFVKVANKQSGS